MIVVRQARQSGRQPDNRLVRLKFFEPRFHCFRVSGQYYLRCDFSKRLQHKPAQVRPRMRQCQFRRIAHLPAKRNQIKVEAARFIENFLWLAPNSFSIACNLTSRDFGVSRAPATSPTTAFTNGGEPGGQSTGEVCQSEDLTSG